MKKVRMTLSGGWHNMPPITIHVNPELVEKWENDRIRFEDMLSNYQLRKIENHFCGMNDCCCGGWRRDDVELEY